VQAGRSRPLETDRGSGTTRGTSWSRCCARAGYGPRCGGRVRPTDEVDRGARRREPWDSGLGLSYAVHVGPWCGWVTTVRPYAVAGEGVELRGALGRHRGSRNGLRGGRDGVQHGGQEDEARRSLLDRAKSPSSSVRLRPMPHLARVVALCAFCRRRPDEVLERAGAPRWRASRRSGGLPRATVRGRPLLVEATSAWARPDERLPRWQLAFRAAQPDAAPAGRCPGRAGLCDGELVGRRNRRRGGIASFERSIALQEGLPDKLEGARTRLLYGCDCGARAVGGFLPLGTKNKRACFVVLASAGVVFVSMESPQPVASSGRLRSSPAR
jgi:hypothetical protein